MQEALVLQQSANYEQYQRRRVVAEHPLARLEQLSIRQARYFGRVNTKWQLYLAATVANLTLMANQIGVFGDPDNDDYAFATGGAVGGDRNVVRRLLPTWILAWLRSRQWLYRSSQPGLSGRISTRTPARHAAGTAASERTWAVELESGM